MVTNFIDLYFVTRNASRDMVKPLHIEDYIPQPVPFVSPPRWVLGHTTWFFEELVLKKFKPGYKEFKKGYGFLFNSYYNSVGDRTLRQSRGDLSRPTVDEVFQYREYVDKHMKELMSEEMSEEISEEVSEIVTIGINHEQQHQELFFTDIKYTFSVNPIFPAYSDRALVEDTNDDNESFIRVKEGIRHIGHSGKGFRFDNELSRHKVFLGEYEISNRLVTNGEYLEFIEDGGYKRFEFWHDEALAWTRENSVHHPMYWHLIDGKWNQFTLAGLRVLQPENILTHISYYEAYAYARWRGMRLPTEFEWEAAADNINRGKRWEWTESAYLPYPGYKMAKGTVGEYNGKFMVNQKVLRGASVVTPPNHSRKTYRNFFHPHIGYQFNGIRLVKSI